MVFLIKIYTASKLRTLHPRSLPQTSTVFGLNVHVLGVKAPPKCNEKDNFHKALPNVKKAYVTLRKFTPNLKIFYTDISAISVTLCNSACCVLLLCSVHTVSPMGMGVSSTTPLYNVSLLLHHGVFTVSNVQ